MALAGYSMFALLTTNEAVLPILNRMFGEEKTAIFLPIFPIIGAVLAAAIGATAGVRTARKR
jgi:hypothetical protein